MKSDLSGLQNIGATIEKRLNEIGVNSKKDLQRIGAVKAYQRIKQNNPDKTISVCYYLYSFQDALEGKHWNDISERTKRSLLHKIEKISN